MKRMRRILLIEDNSDDEDLLLRQLKKTGLERNIKVIRDGGKALDYLMDERFQCDTLAAVFLDLRLPEVDGVELLEKMRAEERLRHVPVVVMTSSNAPEELARCRQLGVNCYVKKPLTFSSFANAFAEVFRSSADSSPNGFHPT